MLQMNMLLCCCFLTYRKNIVRKSSSFLPVEEIELKTHNASQPAQPQTDPNVAKRFKYFFF